MQSASIKKKHKPTDSRVISFNPKALQESEANGGLAHKSRTKHHLMIGNENIYRRLIGNRFLSLKKRKKPL